MLTTSLQRLFDSGNFHGTKNFNLLMKHYGKTYQSIDDSPIHFSELIELFDLEYAIDCTYSRLDLHKLWREFAVWCCEPLSCYITIPSCSVALNSAKKFINDEISFDELTEVYKTAYEDQINDISDHLSLSHCANRIAMDAAHPHIDTCITNCFNTSALGLNRLGLPIEFFEAKQKDKFLSLDA